MENFKHTKYHLLDKHYKSNNFTNGRKFKKFFDDFARKVFETNLTIQKDLGEFPLRFGEKTGYSSIAHALHTITPYTYSEVILDCKNAKKPIIDQQGKEKKMRSVDFWCQLGKGNEALEVWIEHKYLWLNVSTKASAEFNVACIDIIKHAREQIRDIKKMQASGLKVATFAIQVYADKNRIMSNDELEYIPKYIESVLADYKDNRSYMGVLCGVLDMRESIGKPGIEEIYHRYYDYEVVIYTPYMVLGAIVLE